MHKYRALVLTLLCGCGFPLTAQKQVQVDQQIWIGGQVQARLSRRWGILLDAQVRSNEQFTGRWSLVAARPGLAFFLNETAQLAAGYAYFGTILGEGRATALLDENRLWQQLLWQAKTAPFAMQHRLRLEERWLENAGAPAPFRFNYRMRYMLALAFPLTARKFAPGGWQLLFNDEVMLNFGKQIIYNTFDQNRIYGALAYQISTNSQIQLGYLNAFQQKTAGDQYLRLHVIRLLYNHKFDWRKHAPAHG